MSLTSVVFEIYEDSVISILMSLRSSEYLSVRFSKYFGRSVCRISATETLIETGSGVCPLSIQPRC